METTIAVLAIAVVSVAAMAGAVWAFWLIAHAVDFRLRGYRVRQVTRTDYTVWRPDLTDWLYEEVTADRRRRSFRCCARISPARAGNRGPGGSWAGSC